MTETDMAMINLLIFALSLLGFVALALATERHAKHLLRRVPSPRWRLLPRISGWLLLVAALVVAAEAYGWDVGLVFWLAWLSVASMVLIFSLPKWPWQPVVPARKPRADEDEGKEADVGELVVPHRIVRPWLAVVLLAGVVLGYGVALRGVLV